MPLGFKNAFERLGEVHAAAYEHNTAKNWCILIKVAKIFTQVAFDEFR